MTYVSDTISKIRQESVDQYFRGLLALPPYISESELVRDVFAPREGEHKSEMVAAEERRHNSRLEDFSPGNAIAPVYSRSR